MASNANINIIITFGQLCVRLCRIIGYVRISNTYLIYVFDICIYVHNDYAASDQVINFKASFLFSFDMFVYQIHTYICV